MTFVFACVVSLVAMALFAALFVFSYCFAYKAGEYQAGLNSCLLSSGFRKCLMLLLIFLGFFLCWYLVAQNRFVYYWDYGGYWQSSCNTMTSLFQDPMATLKSVYESILENDYNNLLPLLVALPLHFIGYSFTRYVLINYLLFLAPVFVIVSTIAWKLLVAQNVDLAHGKRWDLLALATVFSVVLFTPFYRAMLHGYIDIACLVPATLAIYLFIDYDCTSFERKQVIRDLLISLLLLSCFLFRRYFAFYVVGYGAALVFYSAYKYVAARRGGAKPRQRRNIFLNLLVVVGFASALLLIFFRRLVERILENNYANQYEAYDATLIAKLGNVVSQLGLFVIVLACLSVVLSLAFKRSRKSVCFLASSSFVTMVAFFRVQKMGEQHIYTIAANAILLALIGVCLVLVTLRNKSVKTVFLAVCALTFGANATNCFVPAARNVLQEVTWLYSTEYDPLQRNDIDQLRSLVSFLNGLTEGTDDCVYVVAGSSTLNDSVLASIDLPYNSLAVNNLNWAAQVDLRDGFRTTFFDSTYVVTTSTCQLGLKAGTQQVLTFLWQEIQDQDSPIGRHFTKLEQSFQLDDGVTAYVYKKASEFEQADYQYVADYYHNLYPDADELFYDNIMSAADEYGASS